MPTREESQRRAAHAHSAEDLQRFVGTVAEPPRVARYGVSEAMIRNWVEALEDRNPVYVDDVAAQETGRSGMIAPRPWSPPGSCRDTADGVKCSVPARKASSLGKRYKDDEQATITTEQFTLLRFRPKETA